MAERASNLAPRCIGAAFGPWRGFRGAATAGSTAMLAVRTGKMPVLREEPQGRTTIRSTPGVGVFGLARLSTGQKPAATHRRPPRGRRGRSPAHGRGELVMAALGLIDDGLFQVAEEEVALGGDEVRPWARYRFPPAAAPRCPCGWSGWCWRRTSNRASRLQSGCRSPERRAGRYPR